MTRDWIAEKAALMVELLQLPRADKEQLILAATTYRSGEDSCNSVYMGGMAHANLRHAIQRPERTSYEEWLPQASDPQIDAGLDSVAGIISHMRKHPTKKCPCCGQIVPAKEDQS